MKEINNFKYDVAFSFLNDDEKLVRKLNVILSKSLKTFVYFERQKEVAGTDGELTFNTVFGKESRCVVVLYRKNWGKTPWTRIEETAIRNRGYEEGYDFVYFIPLDEPPGSPKWLPKTQILIGLNRWGINCTASVIESRVQSLGGVPKVESLEEKAARIENDLLREKERISFLRSSESVRNANIEIEDLFKIVHDTLVKIKERNKEFVFEIKKGNNTLHVFCKGLTLRFGWYQKYSNSLTEAKLIISIWKGRFRSPNSDDPYLPWDVPVKLTENIYKFNKDKNDIIGWVTNFNDEITPSSKISDKIISRFLDEIYKTETS